MRFALCFLAATVLAVGVFSDLRVSAQSIPEIETRISLFRQLIAQIGRDRDEFVAKGNALKQQFDSFPSQYQATQLSQAEADARKKLGINQQGDQLIADYFRKSEALLSQVPDLSSYLRSLKSSVDAVRTAERSLNTLNQQQLEIFPQMEAAYQNRDANRWNRLVDTLASLYAQSLQAGAQTQARIRDVVKVMSDAQTSLNTTLKSLQVDLARAQAAQSKPQPSGPQIDAHGVSVLMSAIQKAAKTPECVGAGVCNFFVGKVAELVHVPYFNGILKDESSDGRNANKIYAFVTKADQSKPSGWKIVSGEEAQELANSGRFVIGVARNVHPSPENHGHVALVVPSGPGQLEHSADATGSGPWIRDSQSPTVSVRVSKRFGSTVVEPIYAVWEYPIK